MNNPKEIIIDGEIAYRYVGNPYYYITKSGVLYSTYIKGGQGKYSVDCIRKVAYGEDDDGYYRVVLSLHGKRKYVKIHPNSVSSAFKTQYAKKMNRYTITFPNVSTTENIAV